MVGSLFCGGSKSLLSFPLAPQGTAFQERVWQLLREIPYGETKTYGQLAQDLSCGSAQAVGQAVGRNPLTILVPCHRVMGKDGQLTGYASGLDRKRWLLHHERNYLEGEIKAMYTFIEYPKCSTCRKAKSEFGRSPM